MIQTVEDLLFLSPQQSEYFGDHMIFIGKGGGGGISVVAYKIKEGDYRKLTTNERNHQTTTAPKGGGGGQGQSSSIGYKQGDYRKLTTMRGIIRILQHLGRGGVIHLQQSINERTIKNEPPMREIIRILQHPRGDQVYLAVVPPKYSDPLPSHQGIKQKINK